MKTVSTTIPFSGFYNSIHSDAIDSEIEYELEYFTTEWEKSDDNADYYLALQNEKIDYSNVYMNYAREYAEDFISFVNDYLDLNIKMQSFSLDSPKYYNYDTDRIFIDISFADAKSVYDYVTNNYPNMLKQNVSETFTSHSGFISSYPNEVSEWGDLSEWDHNQIGILFYTLMKEQDMDEYDIMEDSRGNGLMSELLYHGVEKYLEKH